MGGHEPRDAESDNVAYGPWAVRRDSDDPGLDRAADSEHHAAVSSANPMDCENAPAPSFVRTQSPTPASSFDDHSPRSLPAELSSHPESSNLFLEGDRDQQPITSPNDHSSRGDDPAGALGSSSWSATAAAHRADAAKFTRAPDSAARRLVSRLQVRPSTRLSVSGAAAALAIAAVTLAGVTFLGVIPTPGALFAGRSPAPPRHSSRPQPSARASGSTLDRPRPEHIVLAARPHHSKRPSGSASHSPRGGHHRTRSVATTASAKAAATATANPSTVSHGSAASSPQASPVQTPASTSQPISSPTTSSSTSSGSSAGNQGSVSSAQPAFGSNGTLGPGSSPQS